MATGDDAAGAAYDARLARTLLTEAREELLKADGKAGFLLAVLGAMLTALLGAMCGGALRPRTYGPLSQALLWAGCLTCVVALALLGTAVTPRVGVPRDRRAHYFGDVQAAASAVRLREALSRTDPRDRDLSQLTVLSRTIWIKYRCIRQAMLFSASFAALTLSGILTGLLC
jgi:hypothetical protein